MIQEFKKIINATIWVCYSGRWGNWGLENWFLQVYTTSKWSRKLSKFLIPESKLNYGIHAAAKSLQPCPTLSDPVDCSPPGSSVHGIFQARVLEWGAIALPKYKHTIYNHSHHFWTCDGYLTKKQHTPSLTVTQKLPFLPMDVLWFQASLLTFLCLS